MRPPAATGYVSPNDIRIAGSIGNRNFPTPLLLTSIALPSSPSLFFTAAAAFLPRSCARNYNKCRARNTRTEKYHSSRKWSNGVPFSFFFFFFFANVFSPSNVSPPPYAYDCTRYIASRARREIVARVRHGHAIERERERERSTRRRGSIEGEGVVKVREIRRRWRGKVSQVTSVG